MAVSMFAVERQGGWGMLLGLCYCSRTVRHTDILQRIQGSEILNSEMLRQALQPKLREVHSKYAVLPTYNMQCCL